MRVGGGGEALSSGRRGRRGRGLIQGAGLGEADFYPQGRHKEGSRHINRGEAKAMDIYQTVATCNVLSMLFYFNF